MNNLQEWLEYIKKKLNKRQFSFPAEKSRSVDKREDNDGREMIPNPAPFLVQLPHSTRSCSILKDFKKGLQECKGLGCRYCRAFFFHQSWISICMAGTQRAKEGELVREKQKFIWPCSGSDLQTYQRDALKKATRTVCKVPSQMASQCLGALIEHMWPYESGL